MKIDFEKISDKYYIDSLFGYQYGLDVKLKEVYSLLDEYGVVLRRDVWEFVKQKSNEEYIGQKGIIFLEHLPKTEDYNSVLGLFINKKKVYVMLAEPGEDDSYDEMIIHYYDYDTFKKKEPETCSASIYHILTDIKLSNPNTQVGIDQNSKYSKELEDFLDYANKFKNPLGNYDCIEVPKDLKKGFSDWWTNLFNKFVTVPKDLNDKFFAEHKLFNNRAGQYDLEYGIRDVVQRELRKFMKSERHNLSTPQKIDKFNEELYKYYIDIEKQYKWFLDKNSQSKKWYTPENFIEYGLWENGHELWDDYKYPEYDPSMTIKYIEAKLGGKKTSTNFYNLTEKEMINILKKNGKAPTYQVRFSKISGWNWTVYGAYVYKNELVLDIDILGDSTDMSGTISWKDFAKGSATVRGVRVRIDPGHVKKVMNMIGAL